MRETRDREQEQQAVADQVMSAQQAPEEEKTDSSARFEARGSLPEVSQETGFEQKPTASTLAFDGDGGQTDEQVDREPGAGVLPQGIVRANQSQGTYQTWELKGRHGTYLVKAKTRPDSYAQNGNVYNGQRMHIEITMKPNGVEPTGKIGFVQVTRKTEVGSKQWADNSKEKDGMSAERERRTENKLGYRVDRDDDKTSAFYGTTKGADGKLVTGENATLGDAATNPKLKDAPLVYNGQTSEFISTATDTESGKQYDAIRWGLTVDSSGTPTMINPEVLEATDEELVGRDRAINHWNHIADNPDYEEHQYPGSSKKPPKLEHLVTELDPVAVAHEIRAAVAMKDVGQLRTLLKNPKYRTRENITRIKSNYKANTDTDLSADLKAALDARDEKALRDWL